jgi:hypothetical protein
LSRIEKDTFSETGLVEVIISRLDPDSNVTEESDLHPEKRHACKTLMDEGRMSSTNRVQPNAEFPIRDNLDPDLNVTEESDVHPEKQFSPKISTDEGTIIATKPLQPNAAFQFVIISILIQV